VSDSLLSAYGYFTFPPPEAWPAEARRTFRQSVGERSLIDVCVFDHGTTNAMYMEDAVTALAVLPITREEWFTRLGYPSVMFDPSKLEQYSQRLADAGYRVVVMEKCTRQRADRNGKVVSIASARVAAPRRRHKWA